MINPTAGAVYRYAGKHGLGQAARIADPTIADELNTLPSEVAQLDMPTGTTVTVIGHDDDRGPVLVEWTDRAGTVRITSVTVADLYENFDDLDEES